MAVIIDCSNHQGSVDWAAVIASGRAGAIVKATEGLGYVDPTFARNWAALGSLNATRGAYHFARPASTVAEVQADKFLKVVGPTKPDDILVLDLEVGDGNLSDWALRWLARVQAATGITPWLYSYAPFIRAHLTDPRLAANPLWLAAYQTNPPPCPPPWSSYICWQRTDKASVPGVSGLCDESTGDFARVVPPPPPPLPPQEVEGVRISHASIPISALDDQGRGWVSIPAPLERVIQVNAQGSAPERDHAYWPAVTCNVNDSGDHTVVTLAGAPQQATVVYYALLEEA